MKRKLGKIMAFILSLVMALGLFAGCELVAVDKDKDMAQVVATVGVDAYGTTENIYKRELVSGYVNYGYQYVSYGYTLSQTYELILNNLINNKVITQYSKSKIAKNDAATIAIGVEGNNEVFKSTVAYVKESVKYLDEVQIAEAVYSAHATFNAMLDSFDESVEDETDEVEDETVTERTVPTVEEVTGDVVDANYAEEKGLPENTLVEDVDEAEYNAWLKDKYTEYVAESGKPAVATTASRKKAFKQLVEMFEEYGLIGEDEYSNLEKEGKQYDITNYQYFYDVLASNIDSFVVANFEEALTEQAEGFIGQDEALWDEYQAAYNTQKAKYEKDLTAYESALDGLTEKSFVLYNPEIGDAKYGYVANILIGFSDEATAALNAYKAAATSNAKVEEYRANLLNTLVAKDLRSTWLQKGYAEKNDTWTEALKDSASAYSFGDDYVKTEALKQFKGTFKNDTEYKTTTEYTYYKQEGAQKAAWADKEVENNAYNFNTIVPTEFSFQSFVSEYLSLIDASLVKSGAVNAKDYNGFSGTIANFAGSKEEKLQVIDDILFAFGTDPGSLNNYLGYLYSPKTSATTYVKEFADAAKELVAAGVGSFKFVATDFGYHVMICTHVVEPGDVYASFADFKADLETEGTVAYNFKEAKKGANLETLVSNTVTYSIAKYIEGGEKVDSTVKKVEKALKDLIAEEEK